MRGDGVGEYGRFGVLSRVELERFFYLDDEDRKLIAARRRDYNRLGFALRLVAVRYLGLFLADPLDVPAELLAYLAEQLEIADPACVKQYTEREKTKLEHAWEIQREQGLTSFADVDGELMLWIVDQAWMTGDGPKALLAGAVRWLRERSALLPGVTTLERMVVEGKQVADQRLWTTLAGQLLAGESGRLWGLLLVPVASPGAEALTRDRLRHVDQHYIRAETMASGNTVLVNAQAAVPLAQLWGGGCVASVDGMRFVVPVRTIHARPNRKYFGPKRGMTWLNMLNDQAAGLNAQVVSGTPKDSLNFMDVVLRQHEGSKVPEEIITDTGSYSDIVFGLAHLQGFKYRPQLANLPDQRLWRIDPAADYGPLDKAARGRIDLDKIGEHWEDMCRVAVSMHRGEVSGHEVTRMISRDGNPTALGHAIAHYGGIFKTLHILRLADDEPYRREAKAQANLQEGRRDLGRTVFHGHKGEVTRAYLDGMENQLSALGLILNCIVLWNSVYLDRAVHALRAQDYPVRDEDATRLSAFMRKHIRLEGHYSFNLPELGGTHRPLRDPDAPEDDE